MSIKPQAPVSTFLSSLVRGFILTQRTDCRSPNTIEYYEGILNRFLWYAERQNWPDDTRLVTEWYIRDFLAYVSSGINRWGAKGNGSESSRKKATYSTVHNYYCVLKAFFNWCVRENYIQESPLVKVKLANPKLNLVRPYTSQEIMKLLAVCDHDFKDGATAQKALWRYMVYRHKNNHSELWLTEEGRPMKSGGIQVMIKRLKERAGVVSSGNCHRFRHTFALSFLRQDRNPFNLQYLLGHPDLRMVKHYVSTLGMEDALKAHEITIPTGLDPGTYSIVITGATSGEQTFPDAFTVTKE